VKRLLDAGADLDSRGDHGLTPLDFAQQNGHDTTVGVLIEAQRSG
jgi:ankyrin repeat protein